MSQSDFTQELERNVRAACAELRERLRAGEVCRAEQVFARYAQLAGDAEAALEILYTEFVTREELGQAPAADDFYQRFPQWKDRLKRLLDVHIGLGIADSETGKADTLVFPGAKDTAELGSLPKSIGPYEILGLIGRGGMGAVYQARHPKLKRLVALKRLLVGEWANAEEGRRFRTEAEAISRLDHPNIVKLYEVGEHGGQAYLVLELVSGGSLAELLAKGPLPAALGVEIVESLARALQHAHERGILHRDLKPANILLRDEGQWASGEDIDARPAPRAPQPSPLAKIADFGLAKQLDASHGGSKTHLVGTPAYLAPERLDGKGDSPAGDVYSLGIVLYECLTGRPPFLADTPLATLALVREREPLPPTEVQPDCPRDLATICMKCLQKDPRRRYQSAAALADDLKRFRTGEPIYARPIGAAERVLKWARRRPAVAALLALVISITIGGGGLVTYLWLATARALEETENERRATANALKEVEKQRLALEEALAAKLLALARYHFSQYQFDAARQDLQAVPDAYRDAAWRHLLRQVRAPRGDLRLDTRRVVAVGFSPDNRFIAIQTATDTHNFHVWNHASGQFPVKMAVDNLLGFFFQPDSLGVGVVSLRAANPKENRMLVVKRVHLDGSIGNTHSFAIPPGPLPTLFPSHRLAAGAYPHGAGASKVVIWNLNDGTKSERLCAAQATSIAFSQDGRKAGIFFPDPPRAKGWKLQVVDWESQKLEKELLDRTTFFSGISSDFHSYFSVRNTGQGKLATVAMYDGETDKLKWQRQHEGVPVRAAISPDGASLAVVGEDRSIVVLDTETGEEILTLRGHRFPISQFRFSSDSGWMVSFDADNHIRVWAVADFAK